MGVGTQWPDNSMSRAPKAEVSKALEWPSPGANTEQQPGPLSPLQGLTLGAGRRQQTLSDVAQARSAPLVGRGGFLLVDLSSERPVGRERSSGQVSGVMPPPQAMHPTGVWMERGVCVGQEA